MVDDTDLASAFNLDIQTYLISNIITNKADDTSAVNVAYLSSEGEEIILEVYEKCVQRERSVCLKMLLPLWLTIKLALS